MDFYAVLDQVLELLQRRGRVSYRALKLQFHLDDEHLEALKEELLYAHHPVADEAGRGLVWTGEAETPAVRDPLALQPTTPRSVWSGQVEQSTPVVSSSQAPHASEAERRQLTVMFCDLVDSTRLSGQLDPEDLREVVRAYQHACAEVIQRLDGYIAQYLGDGLLVYFGYPQAHEDDAQRAVRAGLGIVETMETLNTHLEQRHRVQVAVRLGIHTGVVVVGEVGSGSRQENLALGETPNIAARIQGLGAPDTVVISAATFRLVQGYFTSESLGAHALRGVTAPVHVYRILGESGVQSRLDAVASTRLTPLVGREEEVALLQRRWEQTTAGIGQVVLLSGEAGIGKSRLVQGLKAHVADEPHDRIEWRGSPYHQQSALYPVIDHLHHLLRWHQRIAQVLAERFPETAEMQPELLAHHYTEAGLGQQSLPYWQRAGQRALQRSAHAEVTAHIAKGLSVLFRGRQVTDGAGVRGTAPAAGAASERLGPAPVGPLDARHAFVLVGRSGCCS